MRGVGTWLAGALALGAPAWAQTADDPGFARTRLGGDVCLYYGQRNFDYAVDAAGSARTPGETEFAAIDAAFSSWQTLSDSCSDTRFNLKPRVDQATVGYDRDHPSANRNVVLFRETSCHTAVPQGDPCGAAQTCGNVYRCWEHDDSTIALTTMTFNPSTGAMVDADIELNAATNTGFLFTTVSDPPCDAGASSVNCVDTDVQNTVTHEIGHAMGFDHWSQQGSTMEASAPPGEISKRQIDSGTARGFCETYPKDLPTPPCAIGTHERDVVTATGQGNPGFGCGALAGFPSAGRAWPVLLAALSWAALRGRRRGSRG